MNNYCSKMGIGCEFANLNGYCSVTGCRKSLTWSTGNKHYLFDPETERMCYSDNEPEFLYGDKWHGFRCSECGNQVNLCHNRKPNYCPNCGARVVKD